MIVLNDHECAEQIAIYAGCTYNPAVDVSICRIEDDVLLGGVLYQNYTQHSITMHIAGFRPRWINKDGLWAVFSYPFDQLKCQKIFGSIRDTNSTALEFVKKLGFIEVTRIEDVYPDGGLVVVSMSRDSCRWLDIKPSPQLFDVGGAE